MGETEAPAATRRLTRSGHEGSRHALMKKTSRAFHDPVRHQATVRTTFDQGVAGFPRSAPPPETQEVRIRVR